MTYIHNIKLKLCAKRESRIIENFQNVPNCCNNGQHSYQSVKDNVTHYAVPFDHQNDKKGHKQGLRLSQLFFYLIWEFQNSVVNVGKNCRLFHLGVGCIHVPIFDVVPGRPLIILGSRESHSLDCVVEEHGILWHNSHRLSQT